MLFHGASRQRFPHANATDKTITYTSSNPEVAKIDATTGVLTAVAPGYTEISVTTKSGGYKDTVKLSVYKEYETPVSSNTCI